MLNQQYQQNHAHWEVPDESLWSVSLQQERYDDHYNSEKNKSKFEEAVLLHEVIFRLEFQAIKEDFDVDWLREHQDEPEEDQDSSYDEE